jgi:hypothetical protein
LVGDEIYLRVQPTQSLSTALTSCAHS